jgi:hypothetical protein
MEITKKNSTTFSAHLTKQYGRKGSKKTEEFEVKAKAFLLSLLVKDFRFGKNTSLTRINT